MEKESSPFTIPKYIQNILTRKKTNYEYDKCTNNENYATGYTIRIPKESPYKQIKTLEKEIKQFQNWAQRIYKHTYKDTSTIFHILYIPKKTHHTDQYAIVTIFDPVMKHLETYLKGGKP